MRISAGSLRGLMVACAYFAAAGLFGWGPVVHAADTCDKIPVTAKKANWVGRDMVINGVPTAAAMMTFDASPEQISAEFRQFWQREGAAARALGIGHELILSAIDGTCSYTLQIPARGKAPTTGLFSAAHLNPDLTETPHALRSSVYPLPEGHTILDIVSHDAGMAARTVQLTVPGKSPERAARTYAERLSQDGWHEVASGSAMQPRTAGAHGYALAMQKDGYRLDAAFSERNASTTAVVNVAYHG